MGRGLRQSRGPQEATLGLWPVSQEISAWGDLSTSVRRTTLGQGRGGAQAEAASCTPSWGGRRRAEGREGDRAWGALDLEAGEEGGGRD